ncbi:unnamed protein product [marine sediment metagenome]|uniref:Uncharacterized protein n=1 Tax=marine sediment metagenome TaxID=412755 RepID=X0UF65_9ZZZZ
MIHRGLNEIIGKLHIKMAKGQRPKRRLDVTIRLYANKMVARSVHYAASLTKRGVTIRKVSEEDLY